MLMDKQLEELLPQLYEQDGKDEQIVYVRYYCELIDWCWYAMEYSPLQRLFFGLVIGDETELGYFTLDELESIGYKYGVDVQRDYDFEPTKLKEVKHGRVA
jgi:hypothetical protein